MIPRVNPIRASTSTATIATFLRAVRLRERAPPRAAPTGGAAWQCSALCLMASTCGAGAAMRRPIVLKQAAGLGSVFPVSRAGSGSVTLRVRRPLFWRRNVTGPGHVRRARRAEPDAPSPTRSCTTASRRTCAASRWRRRAASPDGWRQVTPHK